MKAIVFSIFVAVMQLHQFVYTVPIETVDGETSLHFDFKTENGQQRVEDVKYENRQIATKEIEDGNHPEEINMTPIEFRGGYSFISADGYKYTVKYKANENGFQPYVTAHKLTNPPIIDS